MSTALRQSSLFCFFFFCILVLRIAQWRFLSKAAFIWNAHTLCRHMCFGSKISIFYAISFNKQSVLNILVSRTCTWHQLSKNLHLILFAALFWVFNWKFMNYLHSPPCWSGNYNSQTTYLHSYTFQNLFWMMFLFVFRAKFKKYLKNIVYLRIVLIFPLIFAHEKRKNWNKTKFSVHFFLVYLILAPLTVSIQTKPFSRINSFFDAGNKSLDWAKRLFFLSCCLVFFIVLQINE